MAKKKDGEIDLYFGFSGFDFFDTGFTVTKNGKKATFSQGINPWDGSRVVSRRTDVSINGRKVRATTRRQGPRRKPNKKYRGRK